MFMRVRRPTVRRCVMRLLRRPCVVPMLMRAHAVNRGRLVLRVSGMTDVSLCNMCNARNVRRSCARMMNRALCGRGGRGRGCGPPCCPRRTRRVGLDPADGLPGLRSRVNDTILRSCGRGERHRQRAVGLQQDRRQNDGREEREAERDSDSR
jgi:hypothetical protein